MHSTRVPSHAKKDTRTTTKTTTTTKMTTSSSSRMLDQFQEEARVIRQFSSSFRPMRATLTRLARLRSPRLIGGKYWSLLMKAAYYDREDEMRDLFAKGADIHARDWVRRRHFVFEPREMKQTRAAVVCVWGRAGWTDRVALGRGRGPRAHRAATFALRR